MKSRDVYRFWMFMCSEVNGLPQDITHVLKGELLSCSIRFVAHDLPNGVYWHDVQRVLKKYGIDSWHPQYHLEEDSIQVRRKDFPKAMAILLWFGIPLINNNTPDYMRMIAEFRRTGKVRLPKKRLW